MTTPIRFIALILIILAQPAPAAEPARVLALGTFHFNDAGLDAVKVDDINVMTPESQQQLELLTQRLADFRPTAVLLEYSPQENQLINTHYRDYLAGTFQLPANEIYQLGFRIARKAGLSSVGSFDNREVPWDAEALFEYAEKNNSPEMVTLQETIKSLEADEKQARAHSTLLELLARSNDPERDRQNMDFYLLTNSVGASDGWSGADAAASWWHRNFRMYANIQQQAGPGARVIAIGGAGHMAIIKSLLDIDQRIEAEDPRPYLGK